MTNYLKNAWYMAGWAEELNEAGFSREIMGRQIFFYRTSTGIAALLDRCPHRFAPLSLGARQGDNVVCGYHGLTFSPAGKCVRNPFSDRIPAGTDVPAFAVRERDEIIWIWGGDADSADPALIPDFSFIPATPTSRSLRGYTLMNANYEYGTDNLMDLSHIEFVHKGSFAGQGVIFAGKHDVVQNGDTLHSNWWMPDIDPPSMAQGHIPADTKVDHWLDMRWNAPASMFLVAGFTLHDMPREHGHQSLQAHILTPKNAHETHYFWAVGRNHDLDSAEVEEGMKALFRQAFDEEDKPMIEAAYSVVRGNLDTGGDFWAEKPVSLGIDQGGARARRLLETMISREQAASA